MGLISPGKRRGLQYTFFYLVRETIFCFVLNEDNKALSMMFPLSKVRQNAKIHGKFGSLNKGYVFREYSFEYIFSTVEIYL